MLADYSGIDNGLKIQITEFKKALALLTRAGTRDAIRRKVILNVEARLVAIILIASNGSPYDQTWLAASRIEIDDILKNFEAIRATVGSPITDPTHRDHMQNLKTRFSNRDTIFDTVAVRDAARKAAKLTYGLITSSVAATATGVSAISFVGGPAIGIPVTGGTAILTSFTAFGVTRRSMNKAEKNASKNVEDGLRGTFTYS